MKKLILVLLLIGFTAFGQENNTKELTYDEFLGYVKKFHPLVKSANLTINKAQANLMLARGGFDPKIEVDFDKKNFKGKEYYSLLNSSFKIPTWYGIEIKAGFDNNEGVYLNPENTVPNQGLTSLGIAIPLGQGLLINQRMADVRKAKMQINLGQAERKIAATSILYEASLAYFNWKKNFSEVQLYEKYAANAQMRYQGIKKLIEQGDKSAIDSIEAGIIVKNRLLGLEDASLKLAKSKLDLSNFIWLENNIPLELSETLRPETNLDSSLAATLKTNALSNTDFELSNHPKISALQSKIAILNVERKLKANLLLPKIDLGYASLSEPSYINNRQFQDYKIGLNASFPLFLRKERGGLKLAKYKIQETQFDLEVEQLTLSNKISAQKLEIQSLLKQKAFLGSLVKDHLSMLNSEERLFSFGESSLFLINARENNLVSAQLAQIAMENRYYVSNAALFKIMANPD